MDYYKEKIQESLIINDTIVNLIDDNNNNNKFLKYIVDILIKMCYGFKINSVINNKIIFTAKESKWVQKTEFDPHGYISDNKIINPLKYNFVGDFDYNIIFMIHNKKYKIVKKYLESALKDYFIQQTLKIFCINKIVKNNIIYNSNKYLNNDLINDIDQFKNRNIKNLKFCSNSFKKIILINPCGFNYDKRGENTFDIELDFYKRVELIAPITILDFIDGIYRIKSHKLDYWYELYSGIRLEYNKEKNILTLIFDFDHGS